MTIANIPEWTYEGKPPSAHTFFESIALAGLENKTFSLSADTQRKLLGSVIFGKRRIFVTPEGTVQSIVKIAFGMDYDYSEYTINDINKAIQNGSQLYPGR